MTLAPRPLAGGLLFDQGNSAVERINTMFTEVYFCDDRNLWFVSWESNGSEGEIGGFESWDDADTAEAEWWAEHG